jgi:beta-fructofuranosidase
MRTPDQELRLQAEEAKKKRGETAASDPYRQNYHIMPPVGLLNDPNGLIQWNCPHLTASFSLAPIM